MGGNRIMRSGASRRAAGAAAVPLAAAALVLAGCGSGGGDSPPAGSEKEADVALLSAIASRQSDAVEAYDHAIPALTGAAAESGRSFRAQEQEHIDALTKAIRGLGGTVALEPEPIESAPLRSRAELLGFLYEVESATIDAELATIAKLAAPWPRALLGSIVANQAQHLVVIRRLLGARREGLIPEAFENGTTPLPQEPTGKG